MAEYLYGFYSYVLGYNARVSLTKSVQEADLINAKNHPERIVGDSLFRQFTINQVSENLITKICNFKSVQHYYHEASCTHRL
jgi:predicted alpha/beta-fold hydrolase